MNTTCRSRTSIVTGGSTGIGLAITRMLLGEQYDVIVASRRAPDRPVPGAALWRLDLRDRKSIEEFVAKCRELEGGLSLIVACAGVGYECPATKETSNSIYEVFETNLLGHMVLINQLLPLIRSETGGLIFISSIAGEHGYSGWSTYCATKFGLEGYATCLREELRERNVFVSIIRPGYVDTPFYASMSSAKKRGFMSPEAIANGVRLCLKRDNISVVEELCIGNIEKLD